jgi:acylphosphatase
MVDKEFSITGDKRDIFDVGFRPGLVQLSDEVGIKVHTTNLRKENGVRVIASGSYDSVIAFRESIECAYLLESANVDWNNHNSQFMSSQMAEIMLYSNKKLNDASDKLDKDNR